MSKYIYLTSNIDEAGVLDPARPSGFYYSKMTLLNGIPEGYSENQRTGRKINMKHLRLVVDNDGTGSSTLFEQRFLIIYYKTPNGLPVSMNTFMVGVMDSTKIQRPMLSPFNEVNKPSFEVLFERLITGAADDRSFILDLDLKGLPVIYSGATEFQDHVQHGGLYVLSLSSFVPAYPTSAAANVVFGGTLYYNDK